MSTLTPRQLNTFHQIHALIDARGQSPTVQELADALGISKVAAWETMSNLVSKGFIRRQKHLSRSLSIIREPERRATVLQVIGEINRGEK